MIFVDETLIQIDGKDYWLWIAYDEPDMDLCLMMMYISRKRKNYLGMLSILQRITRDLAENAYSQIVLDGIRIRMLVNG